MKITTQCAAKICRAEIAWLKTKAGKNMPVDAESLSEEDSELLSRGEEVLYRPDDHVNHWGTCLDAKRFSKKGVKK